MVWLTNLRYSEYSLNMSAHTELLLEKIESVRLAIDDVESAGEDSSSLRFELSNLNKQLHRAQEAISESKRVLKD